VPSVCARKEAAGIIDADCPDRNRAARPLLTGLVLAGVLSPLPRNSAYDGRSSNPR
jgi:hypothetical protein